VEIGARLGLASARGKKRMWASMNAREPNFRAILGSDHVFFVRNDDELRRTLLKLLPDVLHVHYSGAPEPPTSDEAVLTRIPVTVTTNPFERQNTAHAHRLVKRMFFVSRWLLENRAQWAAQDPRAGVLYNPIEVPCSADSLRHALGIPEDAFVVGRIGRADPGIHDPISLRAFRQIENPKTYFLAISPPENMLRQAKTLNLTNFVALPPTADEVFLSKFYNTIDVLAHARRDGETFGCNIAEAMMHGRTVVSHHSPYMNAQQEVIGDAGYVVEQDNWKEYADRLERLRDDRVLRGEMAARAQDRALDLFEARRLTRRLEEIYLELLASGTGTGNRVPETNPSSSTILTVGKPE
jgi:glycosyltransferase involved in cell wall biosynthesis